MSWADRFSRGISRQIEDAQKKGAFENLPGKGEPLNIQKNPNANPENEAAFKLLNDNDFVLPWMDKGQQIDKELEVARNTLALTWRMIHQSISDDHWLQEEWIKAKTSFREKIDNLNTLIRDYNLEIPHVRLERFILNAEEEIEKIQ